jgi:hypothetical protein
MHRRRNLQQWVLIVICASHLCGCATLVSGRKYEVTLDNRGGATCFSVVDHQNQVVHSGVTPQQVTLKSSSAPFQPAKYRVLYAAQDGVHQQDLNAEINWWTAGNIVIGGIPGVVVDAATGAMWRLPKKVTGSVDQQLAVTNQVQGSTILAAHSGTRTQHESAVPGSTLSPDAQRIQQASHLNDHSNE